MNEERTTVLIVEDEASIRKFIKINLNRNGFNVLEAESGEEALRILYAFNPQIVVLDIMLPGMDGFDVCRQIRKDKPGIAVIMLTARSQDDDKILGLELGADDYMVKPFNPLELVARIKTILRRMNISKESHEDVISFKNLLLDIKSQKFYKNNEEVDLTPTEFSILKVFMSNIGRALSRNELLNAVWGKYYLGDLKVLDVYIRRVREKIEDNPSKPVFIETVWGYGYRWRQQD
ncbi:MAG TPA: response regulator transcription factor [Clostridiaceae bacterium]|nr:response regulator transcription factor [Clostridiaceae bacterium]